jgi:hypothetical protein
MLSLAVEIKMKMLEVNGARFVVLGLTPELLLCRHLLQILGE